MKNLFLFRGFALWSAFVAVLPLVVATVFVLDGRSASFVSALHEIAGFGTGAAAILGAAALLSFRAFKSEFRHQTVTFGLLFASVEFLRYFFISPGNAESEVLYGMVVTGALSAGSSVFLDFDPRSPEGSGGLVTWEGASFFGLGISTAWFVGLGIIVFPNLAAAFLVAAAGAAVAMYFYGRVLDRRPLPPLPSFVNSTL